MTGYKECGRTGRRGRRPLRTGTRCAVGRATARVAPTQKSLPCLKGGGPTEGWWRDTCGENGCALAVSSCGEESPSHGFAVPAPFRQGGRGDGGCGLPRALCALAMTGFTWGAVQTGRRGRRPLRMRYKKCRWAGRCRHRPLRRGLQGVRCKRVVGDAALRRATRSAGQGRAGRCGHRPLRRGLQGAQRAGRSGDRPYEILRFGIFSGENFLRQVDSVISRLFSSGLPSTMGETKEGIA